MTWIRWETGAPSHEIVGTLAEELKIRRAEALGLYNAVCCGFGEYRKDGRVDLVTDTTLEQWAGWEGRRGRFAAVFRTRCVVQEAGRREAPGTIKGWWRQEALLREQERCRLRPGEGTRKATKRPRGGHDRAPAGPREAFPVPSRGNVVSTTLLQESRSLKAENIAEPTGSAARAAPPVNGTEPTEMSPQQRAQRREELLAQVRQVAGPPKP